MGREQICYMECLDVEGLDSWVEKPDGLSGGAWRHTPEPFLSDGNRENSPHAGWLWSMMMLHAFWEHCWWKICCLQLWAEQFLYRTMTLAFMSDFLSFIRIYSRSRIMHLWAFLTMVSVCSDQESSSLKCTLKNLNLITLPTSPVCDDEVLTPLLSPVVHNQCFSFSDIKNEVVSWHKLTSDFISSSLLSVGHLIVVCIVA